ncbi:ABC transporter permease subunit [Propionicimonas sp.]|uniref:ABC transporter permease n=1 Tax=Propionicimonas sp. TaxID=1955623 RepID=UPI0017C1D465|nr:ABC transporter permease subunit [Propionicimonas sp.]MBU3977002.1 ABC transporter permease [Actinomycetota bacterium]MBA3020573.1 ABC transporter permease subunit [Propionicimonas sp.]MBU3984942.1 ABC transporter permease [Actinomycetota bacterium]MBU4007101.1 ABC transporter permease [Actinomycetota bacterium]MBU4064854.1 ABC transporter permease [Actinomycetota bacterium]
MNTWAMSVSGLRTVVELEIRQRIRSKRWIWALLGWFLLTGGLTSLVIWSATEMVRINGQGPSAGFQAGPLAFGLITYLVLGLGLMIAPAFTATTINGDRAAGTLATLQATRLSSLEIVLGKLIAAWLAAAVFLVVALPFIAWSMVLGNISLWQVAVTFAVVFAEVAVVCAIGLGFSAMFSRAAGAAMLTYLTVVVLSVITVIVLALSSVLVVRPTTYRVWGLTPAVQQQYQDQVEQTYKDDPKANPPAPPVDKCTWFERTDQTTRMDLVWWVVVANPFVVVADAAPLPPGAAQDLTKYIALSSDPLAGVRWGVRKLSQPPQTEIDECSYLYESLPGFRVEYDNDGRATVTTKSGEPVTVSPVKVAPVNVENPIWPWGLGVHVLLGAVFFWGAVTRLKIPYGALQRGTRVA